VEKLDAAVQLPVDADELENVCGVIWTLYRVLAYGGWHDDSAEGHFHLVIQTSSVSVL
jgi:hypothetical protein